MNVLRIWNMKSVTVTRVDVDCGNMLAVRGSGLVPSQCTIVLVSFFASVVKVKWGAYAVSACSCGRSSPVSLAFEPVVE